MENPVHIVFGAYGGVGSALARRLADGGARLVLSGRDEDRLQSLARELDAEALAADATDLQAVDDVLKGAREQHGRVDGVANCVGSLMLKPAHLTRPQEWHDTVATNLGSAFAVVRSAAGVMSRQDEGGSVVLVSTAAARVGLPNHEAIAAAKGGVDALVRSAAATYGRFHVRVNSVAPGLVDTPMTERITSNDRARESSESMHALGRIGTADEVARAIEWLLDPASGWITGQTVGVDGGLGTVRSA
ncbi:MAG: SDR family oxidoreductase [Gemmatimonadota bacterium]|jgi:3-oxoacyl-[acyl-carrier protein] reductase